MSAPDSSRPHVARRAFGACDVFAAVLVLFSVFVVLPARSALVDVGAALVALLLGGAGAGLLADKPWGRLLARVASLVVLAIGLALVAILALTASYLNGIYGPVGKGGSIILLLSLALAFPYLVLLPVLQLYWLGPRKASPSKKPVPSESAAS